MLSGMLIAPCAWLCWYSLGVRTSMNAALPMRIFSAACRGETLGVAVHGHMFASYHSDENVLIVGRLCVLCVGGTMWCVGGVFFMYYFSIFSL